MTNDRKRELLEQLQQLTHEPASPVERALVDIVRELLEATPTESEHATAVQRILDDARRAATRPPR